MRIESPREFPEALMCPGFPGVGLLGWFISASKSGAVSPILRVIFRSFLVVARVIAQAARPFQMSSISLGISAFIDRLMVPYDLAHDEGKKFLCKIRIQSCTARELA